MYHAVFFLLTWIVSSLAFAQIFSLPSTNTTGSYTITYSVSGIYGQIDEWDGAQWKLIGGGQRSGTIDVTKTVSGTYTYKLKNCTASQYGPPTCADIPGNKSITVTLTPAVPTLSVTGIENTASNIDTNGTYSFSWNSVATADNYALEADGGAIYYGSGLSHALSNVGFGPHTFRVKACRDYATVCSGWSNTITVTTQYPQPSLPSGPTFSGIENATSSIDTNGSFTVAWGESVGVENYLLQQNGSDRYWGPNRSVAVSGLVPGDYKYKVKGCRDWATNCSDWTAEKTIYIPPVAPVLSASGIENTASNIDTNGAYSLSWKSTAATDNYALEADGGAIYYGPGISHVLSSVGFGPHTFRVKACRHNAIVCSAWSNSITITTQYPKPTLPSGLTFSGLENAAAKTDTNGVFDISWGESVGVENYLLQRNGIDWYWGPNRSVAVTGLVPGAYTYQVKACRDWATNCSAYTTAQTITVVVPSTSSSVPLTSSSRSSSSIAVTSSSSSVAPTSSSRSSSSVVLTSSSRTSSSSSVNGSDTGNGVVNSTPPSITQNSPVGSIDGGFRVDESGAATYTIPIKVPQGVAGVTPQISITYNSQGATGVAGYGMNISGLGSITRCRQTLLQDDNAQPLSWDANDRFCMNGQRLMLVSGEYGAPGSTYKTEIDSYVLVGAKGGTTGNPDYFEVKAKDGSISFFGLSSNSKVLGESILAWSLSRFQDNIGNRIEYVYEGDNTTGQRISRIHYAYPDPNSNDLPVATITFEYTDRTDAYRTYIGGYSYKYSKKLIGVKTVNNNSMERSYNFYYYTTPNRSLTERLERIEECFSSHCYPATHFSYTAEQNYYIPSTGSSLAMENVVAHTYFDMNGDGMQDVAWVSQYPTSGSSKPYEHVLKVALGSTTGFQTLSFERRHPVDSYQDTLITTIDYNADGRQDLMVRNKTVWSALVAQPTIDGSWTLGIAPPIEFQSAAVGFSDINSDGLTDAFLLDSSSTTPKLKYYKLAPRSGAYISSMRYQYAFEKDIALPTTSIPAASVPSGWVLSSDWSPNSLRSVGNDFNGDGKSDVVATVRATINKYNTYPPQISYIDKDVIYIAKSTASGLGFEYFADLDGKAIDVNGDGLVDDVKPNGDFRLNTGAGFSSWVTSAIVFQQEVPLQYVDINLDSYLDMLWIDKFNKKIKYALWNSAIENYEFKSDQYPLVQDLINPDSSYSFMDITGDGWVDMMELSSVSGSTTRLTRKKALPTATFQPKPWLLSGVRDGFNRELVINYHRLNASNDHYSTLWSVNTTQQTTATCYPLTYNQSIQTCVDITKNAVDIASFYNQANNPFGYMGSSAPVPDYSIPVIELTNSPNYVVTTVDKTMPAAGNPSFKGRVAYRYHHARVQAGGRGFLGFEKVTSIDLQSGTQTETTYHQDWPYIGMPLKTVVYSGFKSGTVPVKLSEANNTWASEKDVVNNRIHRVFLDKTAEVSYSLKDNGLTQGSSLQTITTDSDYDSWGNASRMVTTTSGAANNLTKTIENIYPPDAESRRTGRVDTVITTTQRNNDPSSTVTRTAKFEYYGQFDNWPFMLKKEIIEPNNNPLITEYGYDSVGNQISIWKSANVKPGASQTRKTLVAYDSSKRFVNETRDSMNNLVNGVVSRNSLGQPTKIKDANGVIVDILYAADGHEYQRRDATGAWTHTNQEYCGSTVPCPPAAQYRVQNLISGGGKTTNYFDALSRVVRASKVMFDGRESHVDTEYDFRGYIVRKSEPYYSGDPVYWSQFEYDLVGRVKKLIAPDGSITTTEYDGYRTVVTNALNQSRTEERNSFGHLVKVTDPIGGVITYGYDVLGNLTSATTSANGKSAKVQMCYDYLGRKIAMHDPDKGGFLGNANYRCDEVDDYLFSPASSKLTGWWFYRYNDFGELIEQTDTKKQTSIMDYDALGRMVTRTDKFDNGNVDAHTRWYYDKVYGEGSASLKTQGRLTAVVTSYGNINETCGGSNYCQTYTYDDASRVTDTTTYLPNSSQGYINSVFYDAIGRVHETRDALNGVVAGTSGTVTRFNGYGYTEQIKDLASGDILQKTIAVNARGQIKEELRNNGAAGVATYAYDDRTGLLTHKKASLAGALLAIQDVSYEWTVVGNLRFRWNQSVNSAGTARKDLREAFCYDGLNRLVKSYLGNLDVSCVLSAAEQDQEYDGFGNITRKVGMGTYSYTDKGPHAVTATSNTGSYGYDNNGNQTSGAGRSITYSSYDQPTQITSGATVTQFAYGPDRSRFERKDSKAGQTTVTHYLGNVERIQVTGSSVVEWKRYIAGAVYTLRTLNGSVEKTHKSYLFNDHLGSLDVVTDAQGGVTHSVSFDPWGARRSAQDWVSGFNNSSLALAGFTQPLTTRGYTGHEMLDDHGLIHMNGRIFDPKLARFLQADPYIQAATDTQSYNRYTYVRNNPLNATDPSGYFWNFVIAAVVSYAAGDYAKRHNIGWLASVATIVGCATMNAAICGGASFGSTYGTTGNLGLAFVAGVAGAAMSGMPAATMVEKATRVLAGSMLAGGAGMISGGEFGHGVISAGIGSMTGYIFGDGLEGFAAATIVGGTMTEMTGGKFANGAATAAFSYTMSWAAQKYGAGGVSQTGDTDETGRTKEQEQLDRLKFESEIAQLRKDGKLCVDCAVYNSPDDAAKAVLNQTSGLSEQYQLEVSGSIYKQGDKWAYSAPKVGGYGSAPLTTDMIGYHTHPDGSLAFSNRWNSHGGSGSGDAGWVAKSQKTLYLGVKIGNKIAIGTCDYGNCSEWVVGRGPTQPSRILQ